MIPLPNSSVGPPKPIGADLDPAPEPRHMLRTLFVLVPSVLGGIHT